MITTMSSVMLSVWNQQECPDWCKKTTIKVDEFTAYQLRGRRFPSAPVTRNNLPHWIYELTSYDSDTLKIENGSCYVTGVGEHGNGLKYVGGMKDGSFHGKGVLTLPQGDEIGLCEPGRNLAVIRGQLYKGNDEYYRNRYDGEFMDGLFHGKGIWKQTNGDWYYGEYYNHKRYLGFGVTVRCLEMALGKTK